MTGNPQPITLDDPLQVDEARRACQLIANRRRAARDELGKASEQLADKERLYRKARAVAYVSNRDAPSAGMRDALVDDETADDRHARDVARGVVDLFQELLKEIDGERASLHRLIDWSARIDPFASEGQREQTRRVA